MAKLQLLGVEVGVRWVDEGLRDGAVFALPEYAVDPVVCRFDGGRLVASSLGALGYRRCCLSLPLEIEFRARALVQTRLLADSDTAWSHGEGGLDVVAKLLSLLDAAVLPATGQGATADLELLVLLVLLARVDLVFQPGGSRALRRNDVAVLIGWQLEDVLAAGHLAYLLLELAVRGASLRAKLLAVAQACQRWLASALATHRHCVHLLVRDELIFMKWSLHVIAAMPRPTQLRDKAAREVIPLDPLLLRWADQPQ